eukprot:UN19445
MPIEQPKIPTNKIKCGRACVTTSVNDTAQVAAIQFLIIILTNDIKTMATTIKIAKYTSTVVIDTSIFLSFSLNF